MIKQRNEKLLGFWLGIALILAFASCARHQKRLRPLPPPPIPPAAKKLDSSPGQFRTNAPSEFLLLKYKRGSKPAEIEAFHKRYGVTAQNLKQVGWSIVKSPAGKSGDYRRSTLFERCETNRLYRSCVIPNDPYWPSWALQKIQAELAWDTAVSNNIVVCVIDTGVDYSHPDIIENLWIGPSGEHGYTAIGGTIRIGGIDDFYHGTHVAGIIGATGNNGIGTVGVNWRTKILSMKFISNQDTGTTMDAILCFNKMIELKKSGQNIRVCNNSWGQEPLGTFDPAMYDAIVAAENAGIISICASGNQNMNTDAYPFYPASYTASGIISVNSSDPDDTRSGFSNYGAVSTDIAAPGRYITSLTTNGGYLRLSGTSMSCAYVAGTAAMLFGMNTNLTVAQCKCVLLDPASTDQTPETLSTTGGRRLNLAKCVTNPKLFQPTLTISSTRNSAIINWPWRFGDILEESANLVVWVTSPFYGPPPVYVPINQARFFRVKHP